MNDEQRRVGLFVTQPEGPTLLFRPALLEITHVEWPHYVIPALLDKKTETAGPTQIVLTSVPLRIIAMNEKPKDLPDFEKALEELESLVEQLESGDLSLDQSLQQFKRGVELTRHCQGVLEQAQQTVEQLIDPADASSAAPFEPGD